MKGRADLGDDRSLRSESPNHDGDPKPQKLRDTVANILEEARMILPGTQTLFGFQLIVVFNARFQEALNPLEQYVHLGATLLVALATAMLIAPAAYHRQVEPESISRGFVHLSNQLLKWSLAPLMIAICADLYIVARVVTQNQTVSLTLALLMLAVFLSLWMILPRRLAARRRNQHGSE